MSILRDKMKKRLKKEYTIEDLIEDIKIKNYNKALSGILETCDHKERVRFVCDIFTNSKFKSYKAAMARFENATEKFFDGNRKDVELYNKELENEFVEQPVSMANSPFSTARRLILSDILENRAHHSYTALLSIIGDPNDIFIDDERVLSMISIIASRKWPDHSGLRILFG